MMEIEVIHGQIIAKANHYQAVPGKGGTRRIIKDGRHEPTSVVSCNNVESIAIRAGRFRLFVRCSTVLVRFDLDNSLKNLTRLFRKWLEQ